MPADGDTVVCLLCPGRPASFAFAFILSILRSSQVRYLSLRMAPQGQPCCPYLQWCVPSRERSDAIPITQPGGLEHSGRRWQSQELNADLLRPGQPSSVVNISKISFSRNTKDDERSQANPLVLSVFLIRLKLCSVQLSSRISG